MVTIECLILTYKMENRKRSPPKRILVHKLSTMLTKVFNGRNDIKTLIIRNDGFVIFCMRSVTQRAYKFETVL